LGDSLLLDAPQREFVHTRRPSVAARPDGAGQLSRRQSSGAGRSGERGLAGPGYHINRSNLLVLESKADMQKRGQASPDDGDALALTFAQPVEPAEVATVAALIGSHGSTSTSRTLFR
jgi:hypothetical protein